MLYNITNITVLEIIKYNNFLGKRVYVFDIFRSPIEQKMSSYFENIDQAYNFYKALKRFTSSQFDELFDVKKVKNIK